MQKPAIGPQRRTHPLIWCAAIICALVAVVVIIIGLIVIISYLVIRPKTPSISISYANLDKIYYDQYSNLAIQLTMKLRAKNDNAKNHASFYDIGLILGFHGTKIAKLVNKPFVVEKNSSVDFSYVVDSRPILLGRLQGNYLQSSFRKNVIEFELKGKARAKWSMWLVGSIKFSLNLDCELGFFVPNGTLVIGSHCSSKST